MNDLHKSVIKLLLYYDIFDHALSREEIVINCGLDGKGSNNPGILEELLDQGFIFRVGEYYAVKNDPSLVEKRETGSHKAALIMPKALKMAKFITAFPFIRSVSLSGSLSKDYMYDKGDVDYFIIAQPERLWLARTILVIYKKIFLLNSYKYFCLNYFVDEDHMEIEQKNLFTATELFTLMPVTGGRFVKRLMKANPWVKAYFPQFPQRDICHVEREPRGLAKKTFEWVFNTNIGDWLDRLAMKLTVKFWIRKYKDDQKDLFNRSFRLKRHIAKYHPENFQDLILERYDQKLQEYEKAHQISLK